MLNEHPLIVLALIELRQLAFKLCRTVLVRVDLNCLGYPFIQSA